MNDIISINNVKMIVSPSGSSLIAVVFAVSIWKESMLLKVECY